MNLVFFASGQGSNFKVIVDKINKHKLKCKIQALITDVECNAIKIAKSYNIKHKLIPANSPSLLIEYLKEINPDYIFLAGYMSILPKTIIDAFPLKIVNIHPSLLPAFKGRDAIKRAWQSGVKISGVSIHYVNYGVDLGPIISQEAIKIDNDFIKFKKEIQKLEHKLYFKALAELISNPYNKLIVSKCLLGENCRYNGENKFSKTVEEFVKNFKGACIKICPEVDAGFKIPRDPFTYNAGVFYDNANKDISTSIYSALEKFYTNLKKHIKKSDKIIAIFKENSPSCGVKNIGFITEKLRKFDNIFIVSEKDISC